MGDPSPITGEKVSREDMLEVENIQLRLLVVTGELKDLAAQVADKQRQLLSLREELLQKRDQLQKKYGGELPGDGGGQ